CVARVDAPREARRKRRHGEGQTPHGPPSGDPTPRRGARGGPPTAPGRPRRRLLRTHPREPSSLERGRLDPCEARGRRARPGGCPRLGPPHRGCPERGPSRRGEIEEHTSELQSRFELVCRLLLEKKNTSH